MLWDRTSNFRLFRFFSFGMSYEEVLGILGKPDKCEDPVLKTKNCIWGSSDKQIKIKFLVDTVALRSSKGI